MIVLITFIVSGIAIAILIGGKVWQEKTRKSFFLLRGISKGDERVRELSLSAAHQYAELREKGKFFFSRQLPLHTKNFSNKTYTYLQEKVNNKMESLRGNGFLKKNEGISEFLKDIGNSEKEENISESENPEVGSQNPSDQVK